MRHLTRYPCESCKGEGEIASKPGENGLAVAINCPKCKGAGSL